jgi:hypothetical protein
MATSSNEKHKGSQTQTNILQKRNILSLSDLMIALTKLNERLNRLEKPEFKIKAWMKKK